MNTNQPPNISVPAQMPASQVEMLAEARIRGFLLDPHSTGNGETFVANHGITGLSISYWGPSGKRVIISQDDQSAEAARRLSA